MTQRTIASGVIPPEPDAEFVACLEDGLDTSAAASDPKHPVRCRAEPPVPWLQETRVPIAATQKPGPRVDDESERQGTASMVRFAEPRSGFRQATPRQRRTPKDGAVAVAPLWETRSADCEPVILVLDNRNTHTQGAFSEAFEPDRARASLPRIRFGDTPKHGRGRKVAACERSGLTSPCRSDRRRGEVTELETEIAAWSDQTNAKPGGIDWQFRIENARVKRKRLDPKIRPGSKLGVLG